jgi:hypothetical protein
LHSSVKTAFLEERTLFEEPAMEDLTSDQVVEIAIRHLENWRSSGKAKVGGLTTHADEKGGKVVATHLAFLGVSGERYSRETLREGVMLGLLLKLEAVGVAVPRANMHHGMWMPDDPDGILHACVLSSSTASINAAPGGWIWEMVSGGLATIRNPRQP